MGKKNAKSSASSAKSASDASAPSFLSPELLEEFGYDQDSAAGSNSLVFSSSVKSSKPGAQSSASTKRSREPEVSQKEEAVEDEAKTGGNKMNKKAKKRLEKMRESKFKENMRQLVLKSLEKNSLKPEEHQLMFSTSHLGLHETAKEKTTRALRGQKAGIPVDPTAKLQHKPVASPMDFSSDEESDGDDFVNAFGGSSSSAAASSSSFASTGFMPLSSFSKPSSSAGFFPLPSLGDLAGDLDDVSSMASAMAAAGRGAKDADSSSFSSKKQNVEVEIEEEDKVQSMLSAAKVVKITPRLPPALLKLRQQGIEIKSSQKKRSLLKSIRIHQSNPELSHLRIDVASSTAAHSSSLSGEDYSLAAGHVPEGWIQDQGIQDVARIISDKPARLPGVAIEAEKQEAEAPKKKGRVVKVDRLPEVEEIRSKLPVYAEEQPIMEAISENPVVLLCGETGSGKTTQVPQFLYEAGYGDWANEKTPGMIGVTQPRRVAAVSMAQRVAHELNVPFGSKVSYHIRYEHNVTKDTRIKFMTDGVLWKEIQRDFLLRRYSVIILDEAHERNINTDVLIGLLSRIVPLRTFLAARGATYGNAVSKLGGKAPQIAQLSESKEDQEQSSEQVEQTSASLLDEAEASADSSADASSSSSMPSSASSSSSGGDADMKDDSNATGEGTSMADWENRRVTPLRLIVMSATLRVEDFTRNDRLFPLSEAMKKQMLSEQKMAEAEADEIKMKGKAKSDEYREMEKKRLQEIQGENDDDTKMSATGRLDEEKRRLKEQAERERRAVLYREPAADADLRDLIPPPPVLKVEARQFPVVVHFSRKTVLGDFVSEAFRKVSRIHLNLPPGGILIFLTGQQEIEYMSSLLKRHFGRMRRRNDVKIPKLAVDSKQSVEDIETKQNEAAAAAIEGGSEAEADGKKKDFSKQVESERRRLEALDELNKQFGENKKKLQKEVGDDDEKDEEDLDMDAEIEDDFDAEYEDFDAASDDEEEPGQVMFKTGEEEQDNIFMQQFEEEKEQLKQQGADRQVAPLHVLPLYSMLPTHLQMRVFQPPPAGSRLCVIATNVAETSLTIPGIRYVVDVGREKERVFEKSTGVSSFVVNWIAKASAEQRAGRAGRTGPGHCYRLFSSAVYDNYFAKFAEPEMLRTPVDAVVLQMKSMGIERVLGFPFPTPPDMESLQAAVKCLSALGALEPRTEHCTALGKRMTLLPLGPRYAKMLALVAHDPSIAPFVLTIVAALSVPQVFVEPGNKSRTTGSSSASSSKASAAPEKPSATGEKKKEEAKPEAADLDAEYDQMESGKSKKKEQEESDDEDEDEQNMNSDELTDEQREEMSAKVARKQAEKEEKKRNRERDRMIEASHARWWHPDSDLLSLLRVVGAYEYSGATDAFCEENFLHTKSMKEVHKLRLQLARAVSSMGDEEAKAVGDLAASGSGKKAKPPTAKQEVAIRQAIASGLVDRVARRATLDECERLDVYIPRDSKGRVAEKDMRRVPYIALGLDRPVYIHPRSSLLRQNVWPEWVVYHELIHSRRTYMRGVTAIRPSWLVDLAGPSLIHIGKPLEVPSPKYDAESDRLTCHVSPTFGPQQWQLPNAQVDFPVTDIERYRHAARFLLEGQIFPKLATFKDLFNPSPAAVTRMATTNARIFALVRALTNAKCANRKELTEMWTKKDPRFLLGEVLALLPQDTHDVLRAIWPPLEAAASSQK